MQTIIAFTDKKNGFVAGIKWVALAEYPGKNRFTADVRAKASLATADKVLVHSVDTGEGVHSTLGLYVEGIMAENTTAKKMYSLAVAFVLAFPNDLNQLLVWRIDEKRVVVVVVQNGMPIADEVRSEPDAITLIKNALGGKLGATGHVVYTNEPARFFNGTLVHEETFTKFANRSTKLRSIPVRTPVLAASIGILALLIGGSLYSYQKHIKDEKAALAARVAANDPMGPYLDLLAVRISKLGLDRKSLISALNSLESVEVVSYGWILIQIECSAGQCISTWDRAGGTTRALLAAHPKAELLMDSNSSKAKLRHVVPLVQGGLPVLSSAVPFDKAQSTNVETFQLWRNAGLAIQEIEDEKDFKTWPTPVAGDVALMPKGGILRARKLEVTVPFPLATQAVSETPPSVWWESFTLRYAPSDKTKRLTVKFQGNTYVR